MPWVTAGCACCSRSVSNVLSNVLRAYVLIFHLFTYSGYSGFCCSGCCRDSTVAVPTATNTHTDRHAWTTCHRPQARSLAARTPHHPPPRQLRAGLRARSSACCVGSAATGKLQVAKVCPYYTYCPPFAFYRAFRSDYRLPLLVSLWVTLVREAARSGCARERDRVVPCTPWSPRRRRPTAMPPSHAPWPTAASSGRRRAPMARRRTLCSTGASCAEAPTRSRSTRRCVTSPAPPRRGWRPASARARAACPAALGISSVPFVSAGHRFRGPLVRWTVWRYPPARRSRRANGPAAQLPTPRSLLTLLLLLLLRATEPDAGAGAYEADDGGGALRRYAGW